MKFIRPKHFDIAAEDIVKILIKTSFWLLPVAPFGFWKIYELIIEFLKG